MATQYYTATSLDGFIADSENSLEWLFALEGEGNASYPAFIAEVGAIALGSTTYQWILDHMSRTGEGWAYDQPTWVFSSRVLPSVDGADIRFVSGDVAAIHDDLVAAAGEKNVWLVGGGDLVGQFHDAGRLDQVIATVGSVTLGGGAPLLPRRVDLDLTSATYISAGFAELRYDVRR